MCLARILVTAQAGQVLGLRLVEGFPTDLLKVGQGLVRSALLRHDAGFGVAPPPAPREVLVPGHTETRWAALNRGRCDLPHLRDASAQALHQQNHRPASELGTSATGPLAQAREPAPGPLGDEIKEVRLSRERPAASLEEPGERVELRFVALDRCPRPTRRHQRGDHPP